METSWELILATIGAVTGILASLRWLVRDIHNHVNRPTLKISRSLDIKNWRFLDTGDTRGFITLEVTNKSNQTAHRCVATAEIVKQPAGVTHLQKSYPLHWAGLPYSCLNTGADAVDIGTESRRLDVAFTPPNDRDRAWIAMPFALSVPGKVGQAALPKGEYVLKIQVSCDNGRGDSMLVKVLSPTDWQDLTAEHT